MSYQLVSKGVFTCLLTAASSVTASAQGTAPTIQCGQPYTIVSGDTLSRISARAYGTTSFQALYQHNAGEIGANPDLIRVGQSIEIPCLAADGAAPEAPVETAETAPDTTPEAPAPAVQETAAEEAAAEPEPEPATDPDTLVLTFNKTSAPPFVLNSGIIDLYLAEITEVTEGRVQFIDPDVMNRDPRDQFDLVTSGQVDGAYVLNAHLSASHPLLQLPMQPLMGGSAEQTAVSLWRLHDEYLSQTDYFDDAKLLGFVAAPAAHIWRRADVPVTATENVTAKNMYAVPYFEGLDTRGPAVVQGEVAALLADLSQQGEDAPTFFLAHGAARAIGVWTDEITVTEVDYGLYTPTFSVVLSNEAWAQISPQDRAAIEAVSGEKLSARSASWDAFDNGFRSDMLANGLMVQKADQALLDSLEQVSNEGIREWMQFANASGIPGFAAVNAYKANLRLLEDRLLFR